MSGERDELLPGGTHARFAEIEATVARLAGEQQARQPAPNALTATVVVVGPRERLAPAAEALEELGECGAVRGILISIGDDPAPRPRVAAHAIALEHLRPEYVNNAVAALRLSSLPTLVWWRGGSMHVLEGLAQLAERIVLDTEPPEPTWTRALTLVDRTALTDLRWTRLTRWRVLMAHFFDMPDVRDAAPRFTSLRIGGSDAASARLFAGWLKSALQWDERVAIEIEVHPQAAPLEFVQLGGGGRQLTLTAVSGRTCVEACAEAQSHVSASRIVSLEDERLPALLARELRVRSRDLAFEQALRAGGVV